MKKIEEIGWSEELFFSENKKEPVVIILIAEHNGKECIILQKRAENIRQGGEISLPGGFFEEDDITEENAVLRECEEELGISKSTIKIIGKLGVFITATEMKIDVFVGRTENKKFNPNRDEVEKLIFLPVEEFLNMKSEEHHINVEFSVYEEIDGNKKVIFPAKELNLPEIYHNGWKGKKRRLHIYKYEGEVIWGITASILRKFAEKIRD